MPIKVGIRSGGWSEADSQARGSPSISFAFSTKGMKSGWGRGCWVIQFSNLRNGDKVGVISSRDHPWDRHDTHWLQLGGDLSTRSPPTCDLPNVIGGPHDAEPHCPSERPTRRRRRPRVGGVQYVDLHLSLVYFECVISQPDGLSRLTGVAKTGMP